MMRIGVDVGGTNTDAVIMDGRNLLAAHKTSTTEDVADGIVAAIRAVLGQSGLSTSQVTSVMIGTTQFTNAFVERKHLMEVAAFRIASPAGEALPPMVNWPDDILNKVGGHSFVVRGGHHYDGRPFCEFDEVGMVAAAKEMRRRNLQTAAVTSMFSPVTGDLEVRARDIILSEVPEANVTLSSRIGRIGILERENAAIMNASLANLARRVIRSFHVALSELDIRAPFFISQNDGTLMQAEAVERYPVLTFASGPTNSMRGAAYLSGLTDTLVVDIGGTTTDIGMLTSGFPRESSVAVDIGGVRTNFRMPDILSLAMGGGSLVTFEEGRAIVGPSSVGYRLQEESRVFGGTTLTATDIAVAGGRVALGDRNALVDLSEEDISLAGARMNEIVADGIDRMKVSAEPVPLVLVGGGSILIDPQISGVSEVIVPENSGVANAIGASISQVSGEIDRVFLYEQSSREAFLEIARNEATSRAIAAGARQETISVVDVEEVPLAYVPGGAVRVRMKVVGELDATGS